MPTLGTDIGFGITYKESEIVDLAEQLARMIIGLANKESQGQDQKQLNNKIPEKTIQFINQFEEEVFPQAESSNRKRKQVKIPKEILKIKEKITEVIYRKAHESRREYIFDFLNEKSNKNNVSIFVLRGAINDMLEEYERDTNPAITITKLPKTGYREEYQYSGSPRSLPKSPTNSDKSSTNQTIDRGWKQLFGGSGSLKQHIHSPKQPSGLRNSVDLTNTPDILNLKRSIDRSNTLSPASWHKNQKMYTLSVTNTEDKEQEISQNIERAFNQDNSEPQQIQSTFKE
ncbi:10166_t:CDS:2 [Dentiscutata heterogama]|uniref:10166_t:CDS:1 n=1 Tax=Dentiscutata heterogama TaxID=1316150 RepID=A0ACA9JUV8_9GLOM|nr:10166_t:CDS:2 [Dentiscutata heterogama]